MAGAVVAMSVPFVESGAVAELTLCVDGPGEGMNGGESHEASLGPVPQQIRTSTRTTARKLTSTFLLASGSR